MRRFRVPSIPALGERQTLGSSGSHHLLNVIRHGRGQQLLIFDGAGMQALAELVDVQGDQAVIEVVGPSRSASPQFAVHLVIGLPKGPAMDLAVRMATEAGVTDIHPAIAERSVARGDRGDRWRRIAESAAQQCGRADVPTIHAVTKLSDVLALLPHDRRIGVAGAPPAEPASGPVAVLVGPEGGWTAREIAVAQEGGAVAMGLGDWILRTDTAAAVAVAAVSRNNKADA